MQSSWETIVFAIAPRSHMLHVWISRTKTPRFPTNMTYKYVGKYSLHGAQWGGLLPDVEFSCQFPLQLLGGRPFSVLSPAVRIMSAQCHHVCRNAFMWESHEVKQFSLVFYSFWNL